MHAPHLSPSDVALSTMAALIEATLIGRWLWRRWWA